MTEALALLERAVRCRDIAQDYRSEVAAPLLELAQALEDQAERLLPSLALPLIL